MSIKPAEEYIRRLNQIPSQTLQILHNIRDIDKKVLKMHLEIESMRKDALQKIINYQRKKQLKLKQEIEQLLVKIKVINKRMLKLTRKKKQLAQVLYNKIDEPTEELERDLTKYMPQLVQMETKQGKNRRGKKNQEQYVNSQPSYCYCKKPSYGLMVQCDNKNCQTQWFHTDCVNQQKSGLKGLWLCRDCSKQKPVRTKN